MDERNRTRVVGMALVRGLIGEEAVKEAARSDEPCLLEALLKSGALDDTDVEVLDRIPERVPGAQAPPVPRRAPEAILNGGQELDEEPVDGQEVRTCFALDRWKNYRDLRFVAEGGVGRIFAAQDPSLKRTVALKFLRSDEPELARRFMLEAQHQARVEHPNICKVFEVGEWRGQAYLAMQFIQGETLEKAAVRMSLGEKIEMLEVAAVAVNAAHREGLIHRDIKPANILVEWRAGEKPKPYVLDFGLAKGVDGQDLTLHGTILGTMHYMAPEQAMGQIDRIGRRTDVYGLGATLFRILTGRMMPAADGNPEDPGRLRRWAPDIPAGLEAIVMKCLEKDPDRRYESALALAEDLRRCREEDPGLVHSGSWLHRLRNCLRLRRTVVSP